MIILKCTAWTLKSVVEVFLQFHYAAVISEGLMRSMSLPVETSMLVMIESLNNVQMK